MMAMRTGTSAGTQWFRDLCSARKKRPAPFGRLARQVYFDAVMVVDREEKPIHHQACQETGFLQAKGFNERRQPAASVREIHEFLEVAELQRRLERLRRQHLESVAFKGLHDL